MALVTSPREALHIEIKGWLDLDDREAQATLAKAIMALANHGGGFIVVGLKERRDGTYCEDPNRPSDLRRFSQDAVSGIVQRYAKPSVHCTVHQVEHTITKLPYPVIEVPGGHRVPIQCVKGSQDNTSLRNGRYYIRRQGPRSAEPEEPEEWRSLVMNCVRAGREELLDAMRDILSQSLDRAEAETKSGQGEFTAWVENFETSWLDMMPGDGGGGRVNPPAHFRVAYRVLGDFNEIGLKALLDIIDDATVGYTGWSPFWVPRSSDTKPRPISMDTIECRMAQGESILLDPAHCDFWRVSQSGYAALIKGFDEDSNPDEIEPFKYIDRSLPIWRIGECALQAASFAEKLGASNAEIFFKVERFEGSLPIRP